MREIKQELIRITNKKKTISYTRRFALINGAAVTTKRGNSHNLETSLLWRPRAWYQEACSETVCLQYMSTV